MKEILQGLIGVALGLSIAINAALIYSAVHNGDTLFGIDFSKRASSEEASLPEEGEENPEPVQAVVTPAPEKPNGLAFFVSTHAPSAMNERLFNSTHSMVYDNEAVFYIPYSNEVYANESGYDSRRKDYPQILANLWNQNRNSFVTKNKEFSDSLGRYDSDAYATFIIVDDDDHENILAIISDGKLYYDAAQHGSLDPFSMYDTRWNKYIRRDLADLLDDPSKSSLPGRGTATQTTLPAKYHLNAYTQVYSDDKVTIIFTGTSEKGVHFRVENKTDANITIQADSVALNGESYNRITMSEDVAPRSSGEVVAKCDIGEIGRVLTIGGQLRVIDFDRNFDTYTATFSNVAVN